MRIFQNLLLKLLCLVIALAGILLAIYSLKDIVILLETVPDSTIIRVIAGCILVLVAIAGLLPARRRPRRKEISFPTPQGSSSVHLEPVEASLAKSLKRLPEVRSITIKLLPDDSDRKVRITADAAVHKAAGEGIREMASELSEKIADHARQILGIGEVASVDLNISAIRLDDRDEPEDLAVDASEPAQTAAPALSRWERDDDALPGRPLELEPASDARESDDEREPEPLQDDESDDDSDESDTGEGGYGLMP
ncbi:MAG: hypothetical protein JXR94_19225 [Candidatus Hydrogenedentes bacterium]|nr:hypothetical protein [Candidatus Hydrogenedentota bacterium]